MSWDFYALNATDNGWIIWYATDGIELTDIP